MHLQKFGFSRMRSPAVKMHKIKMHFYSLSNRSHFETWKIEMTAVPNPHALNFAIQIFQSAYGSMKSQWLLVMCKTEHSFSFEISLQAREGPASVGLSEFFFSVSLQRTLRLFMNEESRLSHRNLHFQHASMKSTFTFHNSYSKIKLSKY